MALFRSEPTRVRLEDSGVADTPPVSYWADGFGKLATRSLQVLIVLGIAALLVIGLRTITLVTIPVLLALIIACAVAPITSWMRRHGVNSLFSTIIIMLGAAIVFGLVVWLIVWTVASQWNELYAQAQDGFGKLLTWVQSLPFAPSQEQIDNARSAVLDFVTSAQFGTGALAGAGAVANFVTGLVLLLTVLFFFLKDGPRLWEFVLRPFEGANYARGKRIGEKAVVTLGSYTRGTALVALVDAVGIGIGLFILQVPLAVPLTVLVFLLAFIPIVGATLAGILSALVALVANGPVVALIVVGVVVLVNQLEGNFLQPFLMGRTMKLHSFVILIALTVGTLLGGVLGAILAVPITATAWGAIQVWSGPDLPARWARAKRPEGPETVRQKIAEDSIDQTPAEKSEAPTHHA